MSGHVLDTLEFEDAPGLARAIATLLRTHVPKRSVVEVRIGRAGIPVADVMLERETLTDGSQVFNLVLLPED